MPIRTSIVAGALAASLAASASCTIDSGVRAVESQAAGVGGLIPDAGQDDGSEFTVRPGVVDFGDDKPERPYDGFLTAVFGEIEAFWAEQFPAVYGTAWQPLEGGVFAAYPERSDPIPGCGTEQTTYDEVYDSGAFYCRPGDFIAYDDADLLPSLVADLGKEAVAIVLAHEFGHAVQARIDAFDEPVILKEQQADCFAGAWTAHMVAGQGIAVAFDDADIRAGLIAMIQIRDPVELAGVYSTDAHGTGFDRVGAFQDGFAGGAQRCSTFFSENRLDQLIDIPFLSDRDDPNAGNLPLFDPADGDEDIVSLIPASLDQFWLPLLEGASIDFTPPDFEPFNAGGPYPSCASLDTQPAEGSVVFCAADGTVYWDRDLALALAADPLTGDLSVGYLFAIAYSEAVQLAVGSTLAGESRALASECLTGAWVGSIVPPTPGDSIVQLSAGDLDEVIITAISRSDPTEDADIVGGAFEKVTAFRAGVLDGAQNC
ncbi:MAG: neutral zinc metallopeptidase [Ilumatobacteraceae bacterium]